MVSNIQNYAKLHVHQTVTWRCSGSSKNPVEHAPYPSSPASPAIGRPTSKVDATGLLTSDYVCFLWYGVAFYTTDKPTFCFSEQYCVVTLSQTKSLFYVCCYLRLLVIINVSNVAFKSPGEL